MADRIDDGYYRRHGQYPLAAKKGWDRMRIALKTTGYVLLLFGLIGVASIMGGVFSHDPAYATISGFLAPAAFHTVCMLGGFFCLDRARGQAKTKLAH